MKRAALIICLAMMVVAMAACSPDTADPGSSGDEGASGALETEPAQGGPDILSWHNQNEEIAGLSERERIIVDFFNADYFYVEKTSLQDHSDIYENANVSFPLVVERIVSHDEETYEAVAILIGGDEFYDYYPTLDAPPVENPYDLDGKTLAWLNGNQIDTYGELLSEHEIIRIYGRYHGETQKEIDGKAYSMASLSAKSYTMYRPSGYVDPISKYSYDTVARAIFGDDIELERCSDEPGHTAYLLVTPKNQSAENPQSFIIGGRDDFFPINKSDLKKVAYGGDEYYTVSYERDAACSISPDFEHLFITTFDQAQKKLSVGYLEIDTLRKLWEHEFDGVDSFKYNYTNENIYIIIDDKLYILSLKDGSIAAEPVFTGQAAYISMQPDGVLLLKPGIGDNIAKLGFDGNILWSIKVENLEIDGSWESIQNTSSHYAIQANRIQMLAVSFDGEVLAREGELTPSQETEIMLAKVYATVLPEEGLNIREAPSTSAASLMVLPQGSVVEVFDSTSNPEWAHVKYVGNGSSITGYVAIEYLGF